MNIRSSQDEPLVDREFPQSGLRMPCRAVPSGCVGLLRQRQDSERSGIGRKASQLLDHFSAIGFLGIDRLFIFVFFHMSLPYDN